MPFIDDIKSGNITTAVAWAILPASLAATAAFVAFLAAAH
jgi:hypothetical protein